MLSDLQGLHMTAVACSPQQMLLISSFTRHDDAACLQVAAMVPILDRDLRDKKKTAELDVMPLAAASYHSLTAGMLEQRLKKTLPLAFYAEPPTGLFDSTSSQADFPGWMLAQECGRASAS